MAITTLSSREFNQDLSRAKRAAKDGPVFITDRGKAAHVLLTIEEFRRVTNTGQSLADALALPVGSELLEDSDDFDEILDEIRLRSRMTDLGTPADF